MAEQPQWWRRLGALGGRTLGILVAIVILVAAADRAKWLVDASADKRYTVHPRLAELITAQQEPVALVGVWGVDRADEFAPVEALGKQIAAMSPRLSWRRIDPVLHQPLAAAFAKDHSECLPDTLYVVRGTRIQRIGLGPATRVLLQRELGGALVSLADPHPPQVVLLAGHGELRSGGGPGDGDDQLAHALELAGYRVDRRDPTSAVPLPPAAVAVVGGAISPLGGEITTLGAHLTDGGGILVLADDRAPADLLAWLRRRGIHLGAPPDNADPQASVPAPGIIVSLRRHIVGQEAAFPHHNLAIAAGQVNPEHPITGPVAGGGVALLSPFTTGVYPVDPRQLPDQAQAEALAGAYERAGTPRFQASVLLTTADKDAWLKPRAAPLAAPEDLDKRGALPLAVAVEYAPAADSVRANVGGRLLVWGSRQAASDGVLGQGVYANEEILRRGVDWLARRTAATGIPPAELTAFRVDCTDQTLWLLFTGLVILLPCILLGGAMLTWWDRR